MLITEYTLLGLDACEPQILRFNKIFPDGAELNRENLLKAAKARLNIRWFVYKAWGPDFNYEFITRTKDAERQYDLSNNVVEHNFHNKYVDNPTSRTEYEDQLMLDYRTNLEKFQRACAIVLWDMIKDDPNPPKIRLD